MHGITKEWLIAYWPHVSFFAAIFITLPLLTFLPYLDLLSLWIWLQVPIYMLHQFEEHGTGKFKLWINHVIFNSKEKEVLTNEHLFWINAPLTWVLFPLFAALSSIHPSFALWIIMTSILNSALHIGATAVQRKYNPGFWASLVLNMPSGIFVIYLMQQHGILNSINVTVSIIIAIAAHALIQVIGRIQKRKVLY
ncbi:HXXEE domain-containing protein [Virgibacillus siamensis]|uniref:HXXEE domain-containing protein n=1 Tax=Virgibacillus siamensis TaxID=480071 RepID=UPI00098724ED|nr:HXXEE domain-containing protein [Virgibacillus siamensis]